MEIINLFSYGFIIKAYLAGSFVAALCAMLGLILVLKKLSLIGDGLSHVSFGAIALGLFLGIYPIYLAIPIVLLASFFILKLTEKAKVYGDAAIGILASLGVAVGVILASLSKGFNIDLFSYLFGNILAISQTEVYLSIILSLLVLGIIIFLYHDLVSTTFDEDYAKASGINSKRINLILTFLTAITVVLAIKVVGVMLVSALLVLPAVSALQISKSFKTAMIKAVLFSVISVLLGITFSFYADLPAGATIIIINFLFFISSLLLAKK